MIMRTPIRFDYEIGVNYSDGTSERTLTFPTNRGLDICSFTKINGYDANNNRVTNLVGYDGLEFLKRCTNCNIDKHVTEFGYSGRTTNGRRDQSQCSNCRSRY